MNSTIDDSLLHDLASRMRHEHVTAIALRVMRLRDAKVDQINSDYEKVVDKNYNMFLAWRGQTGAKMADLQALMVAAVANGIEVGPDVFHILDMEHPGRTKATICTCINK